MEAQLLSMPPQVQSLGHSAGFDSLEDSLLRDLEETGMTELANELGLIQDGGIPELQMQGGNIPAHLELQQAAAAQMLRQAHQAAHQRQQHQQGAQPQRQPQPRQMGAGQAQRPEPVRAPAAAPASGPGPSYLGSALVPFIRQPLDQALDSPEAGEATMLAADSTAREAVAAVSAVTRRLERLQQQCDEAGPSRSEEDDGLDGVAAAVSPNGKALRTKSIRCGRGPPENTRGGKGGMRHFSMKLQALAGQVCEKVEDKGRTTYNEVADELVAEFSNVDSAGSPGGTQYDEKNIRRRVYDALNVLMAMEIIAKEKKDIQWKGLPRGHSSTTDRLQGERARLTEQLQKQQEFIGELFVQQRMFRNLVARNRDAPQEQLQRQLAANGGVGPNPVQLPFILIQVGPEATVEIQITDNQQMAEFDFHTSPFRIMDEDGVLREMGVDQPEPAAAVPTASSRPSSARTTPRGPPSGALQVPQQPRMEGSPNGLVMGFMRQMQQQQQDAHLQQGGHLQGQHQHLPPPVHHQQAQQQQRGPGLHRQLPPQPVQQHHGGGMHMMQSPSQDVKAHMSLQQLELMNGLHSQLHAQHTQQSPRGSPRISHMQEASPQQAAHYRPGGPMPMQQTPTSKPLSTDQSPAPLIPAQLPLHSLHAPQASLVSAPQQMWNFGSQGVGPNASLAQQMASQPGSFPPQISPVLMSQMLQQQHHHHLSLPMMNGLGQLQNNAAHMPQHPLQRK